jgi:hypothetical protein
VRRDRFNLPCAAQTGIKNFQCIEASEEIEIACKR